MSNNISSIKSGVIISNTMQKCLVVKIERTKSHPLYKKHVNLSKKYHVHCEDNAQFKIGDMVKIRQCRPYSKTISWEVVKDGGQK